MRLRQISIAVLAVCLLSACQREQKIETITLGAILPLTGPIAQYGNYMRQGIELAIEDARKEGLGVGVRLAAEDSEADPAKAVAAFRKLTEVNGAIAIIPATSGVILALKPLANSARVILVNASAISTEIEDSDDYLFSVIPDASIEGAFLADSARSLDKRRMAVLYRNDASGKSFLDSFKREFSAKGGTVVFEDAHQPNEIDFRSFIAKISSLEALDGLFMASFGPEVAAYLKQCLDQGIKHQVFAYTTFNSPKVLEIAGDAADGVLFSAPAFDASSNEPGVASLREKVRARYATDELNYYIASHYDAAKILLAAIKAGARDGESIRQYLAQQKTYEGKSGHLTFLPKGAASIPLKLYTVRNRKFVPYEVTPL